MCQTKKKGKRTGSNAISSFTSARSDLEPHVSLMGLLGPTLLTGAAMERGWFFGMSKNSESSSTESVSFSGTATSLCSTLERLFCCKGFHSFLDQIDACSIAGGNGFAYLG
jgi:hypothetical protein